MFSKRVYHISMTTWYNTRSTEWSPIKIMDRGKGNNKYLVFDHTITKDLEKITFQARVVAQTWCHTIKENHQTPAIYAFHYFSMVFILIKFLDYHQTASKRSYFMLYNNSLKQGLDKNLATASSVWVYTHLQSYITGARFMSSIKAFLWRKSCTSCSTCLF